MLLLIAFVIGIIFAAWFVFSRFNASPPSETPPLFTGSPGPVLGPEEPTLAPFTERDTDQDGLLDAQEVQLGTDLTRADTDGDGYTDKQEIDAGFDPLGPGKLDADRDGLSDPDERCWQTDAAVPDTDGDGYLDGQEVANGFDPRVPSPNDRLSGPRPCP